MLPRVRVLRNPVVHFLFLGLLTMVLLAVGTDYLAGRSAQQEALAESRRTNAVLARSVAKPFITQGLVDSRPGAIDQFERKIRDRLVVGDIRQINLWNAAGDIVYSSARFKTGHHYGLDAAHQRVMTRGGSGVQVTDPSRPANLGIPGSHNVVQIFTRFRTQSGEKLLFEGFYSLDQIEQRRSAIYGAFRWITIGGLVVFVILVTPLLLVLTRRLTRSAQERARLLSTAVDASDAERRRIARDLHDSVVQDLAGTAFSISAVARDPGTAPQARRHLEDAGGALRDSLRALRSLLAEIHPPDLQAQGLNAALADLIAPAAGAGVNASVSVEGAEDAADAPVALVWRVAQEAVRNTLRHAEASTLAVTVRGDGERLVLDVVDDGIGFDPTDPADPDSFGLRGMRSLVADVGGTLNVTSFPSGGTTVRLEVAIDG